MLKTNEQKQKLNVELNEIEIIYVSIFRNPFGNKLFDFLNL